MKPPIAFLSDFGLRDNFVGVAKAVMLGIAPGARIVDISHGVGRHDTECAAFMLAASFPYFPRGTVFVSVVDPGVGSSRRAIAIATKNYYFVSPDNGISSIAAGRDGIKKIVILENERYFRKSISSTFHGRDIFAPVAAHLACGVNLARFGRVVTKIREIRIPQPQQSVYVLRGEIIYRDIFGNLVTNITKDTFARFIRNKKFKVTLAGKTFSQISSSYAGACAGPFLIEGSFGFLEISVADKSAARYFSSKSGKKMSLVIRRV